MTEEILNDVDDTQVVEETTETVSKEQYDLMQAEAEKYKGYFKKEKAKQKNVKPDSNDVDMSSIKQEIMAEVSFYTSNPNADQFKEKINVYVEKWLTHDEAYRLVASTENPSLLIDQQTKAKQAAPWKELTGVAWTDAGDVDFWSMTPEEASKLSAAEAEKFWDYKKNEV